MNSYKDCSIFIGIDQSLNSTGYCIHDYSSGELIETKGLIKPGERRGASRLAYIFSKLDSLLNPLDAAKVVLCLEGYAYNYRKGKVFELGEVGGIVKVCCYQNDIIPISVPPTELKKFVTGKGSASKKEMMAVLFERQDDIADAKGLSLIAEEISRRTTTERKKLEVVTNCLKLNRETTQKKKYKRPRKTPVAPRL